MQIHGELPEEWQNKPQVPSQWEWIYSAFFDLATCRSVGFGVGPIPWTALRMYADDLELDEEEFYFFKRCVAAMDKKYMSLLNDPKGAAKNDAKTNTPFRKRR